MIQKYIDFMEKTFYSTSETAELFGISRVTVYRWVKDGKIHAYGLGKNLKIPLFEIKRLLQDFGMSNMSSDEIDMILKNHGVRDIIQAMAKEGKYDL
ncbi:MAG: helix-turn-helix domain-containing protein [Syntrophaceae bacterium]|nr:helix-turn-helix domain-containing protein [Syntrophaceae bacterium]